MAVVFGVAVICMVWLWSVWQQYAAVHALAAGHDPGWRQFFVRGFRPLDMSLRIGVAIGLILVGATSAFSTLAWLNWKFALFGLVVLAGVGIRVVADQFPIALGEIGRLGSTPQREARLNTALRRAYPFVLSLWGLLVAMTALAVAKP
jgi:hypothetical protein